MRPTRAASHHRRAVNVAVLAFLTIVFATDVAWAARVTDNLVPTQNYTHKCKSGDVYGGIVCTTDNATVTYFMKNQLEQRDKNVVDDMIVMYARTDLEIHPDGTPKYTGPGETDIIYEEGPVPGDDEGKTWCNDPILRRNYDCDQQYVRIQGAGHYTKGLSCHETGHAVGLLHGQDAYPDYPNQSQFLRCMRKMPDYDDVLGSNNRSNINHVYNKPG